MNREGDGYLGWPKPARVSYLRSRFMENSIRRGVAALATAALLLTPGASFAADGSGNNRTATPINHVVVIFQENVSFDHYFGTYPHAFNLPGETPFHAREDTPEANSLLSSGLLTHNPNKANPFRLAYRSPATRTTITTTNKRRRTAV